MIIYDHIRDQLKKKPEAWKDLGLRVQNARRETSFRCIPMLQMMRRLLSTNVSSSVAAVTE